MRAAVYYDGFNLYHAIDDLQQPYLKWCNLWKLGEVFAKTEKSTLVKAVFCTAYFPGDHGKRARHETFVQALAIAGVVTRLGHTTKEPMSCRGCGHQWDAPREKETDINLCLAMVEDAYADAFDLAFLVTADTDQAATLRFLRTQFRSKKLVVVTPPGRAPSTHLTDIAHARLTISARNLDDCAFPLMVAGTGHRSVYRPREYEPPAGWMHPDDRPKRK